MLGKHKNRTRRVVSAAPLAIAFLCAACNATALYTGALHTTAGRCDTPVLASLELRGGTAVFSPDNGVLLLNGHVTADGNIQASLRLTGADRKPFDLVFRGAMQGDRVNGVYATPQCRAVITLRPVGD